MTFIIFFPFTDLPGNGRRPLPGFRCLLLYLCGKFRLLHRDFRIVGTSARVEEGETTENGVTLRLKTADKIKAFTRVRLPKQPTDIKAIDEDGEAVAVESSWDEETKTLLVSYQSVSKEVCVTGKWA